MIGSIRVGPGPLAGRSSWFAGDHLGAAARAAAWGALLVGLGLAVALLEPLVLAAAVASVAGTLLVLRWPLFGVALLLFAVPFGSLSPATGGSVAISAAEPLIVLLLLAWLAHGVRRHSIRLRSGALIAAIVAMAALMLLSVTYALSAVEAVKEALKWIELLAMVWVVADLARERGSVTWLLVALFAAGSAEAVWGVVQFATGGGPEAFTVSGALRAYGHFEQPNPFAGYLSTILPLSVAVVAAAENDRRFRGVALAATLALGTGLALSQSRGAWLGLATALIAMLVVWSPRSRRLLVPGTLIAAAGLVVAATGLARTSVLERLGQTLEYFGVFDVRTVEVTSENWSVMERMAHWQAGWSMFLDHPWLGVGAGNYAEAYPDYFLADWLAPLGHAHNYYLNTLAELGVVGFGLLLLVLGLLFRELVAGLRFHQPFWRPLLVGVIGSMIVLAIHNLFDNLLVHGVDVQLGFLIGLGVVAVEQLRQPPQPSAGRHAS